MTQTIAVRASDDRRCGWRTVAALGSAILLLTGAAATQAAERENDEAPGAFPYDLAFQRQTFRGNDDPVVSPDGDRVAYVVVSPPDEKLQSARFLSTGTPVSAVGARLFVSNPAAGAGRAGPICGGKGNQWDPAWSPDGRALAFYSDQAGRPQLWIYDLAGDACRQVGEGVIRASLFAGFEPRWSPGGETVYVPLRPDPPLEVSDASVFNVMDAGARGDGGPLVFYSGSEAAERNVPKGGSDFSGFLLSNYNASLAAVEANTGRTRIIVDARVEPRPSALKVSASGRWISYASVPANVAAGGGAPTRELALVPASGGEPRILVEGLSASDMEAAYRWHPREDQLIYMHDGRVWGVDFGASGPDAPRVLSERIGKPAGDVLSFTRDGRAVVIGVDPQGRRRDPAALAVIALGGGEPRKLPLPDPAEWEFLGVVRANEDVLWQPDPRDITVQMRHRGTGHQALFSIDLTSGVSEQMSSGLYRLRSFGSGGDHGELFVVYEDINTPPDIYRYDADLKQRKRVSIVEPRLEEISLGDVAVIETPAPFHDGSMVDVRTTVLLPPGAEKGDKLPAVVMIYSGSDLSSSASMYGGGEGNTVPNQVFTSRGFAVVMADIRLPEPGKPSHPAQDMTDVLLPQVLALADAGYIDVGKLAISGQSFGGYSTAAIASFTNLFRAGIAVNGPYDLGSLYGGMDTQGNSFMSQWAEQGQGRMGEMPWDNPLRYIANSPYYRIDRIHTPLLLVAGDADNAVPYEQSTQFFVGLRRMERPAELAIYPGQGHSISEWSLDQAVDVSRRMVAFLNRQLREGEHGSVDAGDARPRSEN